MDNNLHRQNDNHQLQPPITPTPKGRGGIPFLASAQAGFTLTDSGFGPATKVAKKTALQGRQLSTKQDALAE